MERHYPCTWTWLSSVNQKKENNNKLKFVNENYIDGSVPKVLFFKTTDLCTVYLFSEYADN